MPILTVDAIIGKAKSEESQATSELFGRGLKLYEERPDKRWSITDCISFGVMDEMGLTEALTADRHFEHAGFTILMR